VKLTIEIQCDNDAFYPEPGPEVARILSNLADRIRLEVARGGHGDLDAYCPLMDYNGNRVGSATVTEDA
jgi:hypothetical protein